MDTPRDDDAPLDLTGFESVPIPIVVRVGRGRCTLGRLVELKPGDLVPLDRSVGAPFDLVAGDVPLGRVEPVADADRVAVKLVSASEDLDDPSA